MAAIFGSSSFKSSSVALMVTEYLNIKSKCPSETAALTDSFQMLLIGYNCEALLSERAEGQCFCFECVSDLF